MEMEWIDMIPMEWLNVEQMMEMNWKDEMDEWKNGNKWLQNPMKEGRNNQPN